ncbi:TraX family protein [Ruminococcus sp.]|uniref:TraX family protein n=1 Tax=Ruminococcus sp. TaxID=41978 RepID=UPI0025F91787|nr:TraX family protein [Ruminococcus sp.]MBQ8967155.1 TraX protein [Ruminococcus sp.]
MCDRVLPEKYRVISGSGLKIIALTTMIIDHTAAFILRGNDFAVRPVFTLGPLSVSIYLLMRITGRIAFPIYCFLITEGYAHTHDKKKYGTNLLVFALISEIPWDLVHTGRLFYQKQNVFFTLFLGFLAIYIYERFKEDKGRLALSLLGLLAAAFLIKADYGCRGVGFILFLYIMREKNILQAIIGSCFFDKVYAVMASFVIINMYSGQRGFIRSKPAKYAFYAAYPLHILLLYFLKTKYSG